LLEHHNEASSPAIEFLRGEGPNGDGYLLHQILRWSNDDWEEDHSFIQWVFPTNQPSMFNADAPVLTADEITIIQSDPHIQEALGVIYHRWLRFCGLGYGNTGLEFGTSEFPKGNPVVWGRLNHNWLRITRVLQSLRLLGRKDRAEEFFNFLTQHQALFSENTWLYWRKAMEG